MAKEKDPRKDFTNKLIMSAINAAMFRLFSRMPWWVIAIVLVALIGGAYAFKMY